MGSVTHTLGRQLEVLTPGNYWWGCAAQLLQTLTLFSDPKRHFSEGGRGGGAHIYMLCGLYKGVPPSLRDDKDYVLFTCTVNRQFSFSIQLSFFSSL